MSTVQAQIDGFVGYSGGEVRLHFGEEYPANHPLVEERPDLFTQPKRQVTVKKAAEKAAEKKP
jgi:hypothetical protein